MVRWPAAATTIGPLAVAVLACSPAPTGITPTHAEAIRDSVAATMEAFQQHSAAAAWDSVAAFYSPSPDFRFFESGQLQYRSAAEVERALRDIPDGMGLHTTYRDTEIHPLGPGQAIVHTLFETEARDGAGAGFSFSGAMTVLWTHTATGWQILHGHSSAPVPRGG